MKIEMCWRNLALAACAGLICSASAFAAPPPNDACANASTSPVDPMGGTVSGTLAEATHDGVCGTGLSTNVDTYHTFTPASAGPWRISLCNTANPFDMVISIHTACPASAANRVAGTICEDDVCGVMPEIDEVTLLASTTYVIRVATYFGPTDPLNVPGPYTLLVTPAAVAGSCCYASGVCELSAAGPSGCPAGQTSFTIGGVCVPNPCPQPPPNDLCASAANLNSVPTFPVSSFSTTGDNSFATPDAGAPGGACNSGTVLQNSMWYRYTPGSSGSLRIVVAEVDDDFDMLCVLFTGPDCATLTEVPDPNCDGDGTTFDPVETCDFTRPLTAGTTYWLAIGDWGTSPGGGAVNITLTLTPTTGACCVSGVCSQTTSAGCTGTFSGLGVSCTPDPCVPAGVCCRGSTCSADAGLQSQATCAASVTSGLAGAKFVAAGMCGASHSSPCCYADYNQDGNRNVTDIFNYLTDWFAASTFAVVGGDGTGAPTVQHIFAFLTDWFAGGCP